MHGILMQHHALNGRFDRRRKRIRTIRANLLWRQQQLILEHLAEEPFGGVEIALGGQQEINGISCFVDGAIQVSPFTTDLDIGLVDPDRASMWLAKLSKPFHYHWCVGRNPTIDPAMIDLETTFAKHLF